MCFVVIGETHPHRKPILKIFEDFFVSLLVKRAQNSHAIFRLYMPIFFNLFSLISNLSTCREENFPEKTENNAAQTPEK